MGLKLRYYESGLIRSEGDAPNGVLAISTNYEEMTFIIHPGVEVPAVRGGATDIYRFTDDQSEQGAVPVDASDVIGGCADSESTAMVWKLALETVNIYTATFTPQFMPEKVIEAANFAIKVRDALAEHGYISRRG